MGLDLLSGINRWETYEAFTRESGWPFERYRAWQFATLARQLLPASIAEAALGEGSPDVRDLSFASELVLFR